MDRAGRGLLFGKEKGRRMKNIGVLRGYPKDAGFLKILKSLSRIHNVECFIWDRQGDYQPIVENQNITYRRCGVQARYYNLTTFLKLFLFQVWLFFVLLFAKVDCIHAIDLDTGFIGLLVAKVRRKRFVYQCLDPYYASLPERWPTFLASLARKIENMVISHADMFIITDLLRMPQHEGAKPKKVVEIANVPFIDVSKIRVEKEGGFIVGYIGSLTEGRNLITIIEAIGELKDEGVKLIIGGFGPIEDQVKAVAGRYENITYTSWIPYDRLLEIESTFDVLLQISDKNDKAQKWLSPNKLFESMAFGKPIIVGEGTFVAKRVASIGNGVAVRYGSKEELQRVILNFKNNPDIAEKMGEMGRKEFESNWNPEVMERKLLEAYKDII